MSRIRQEELQQENTNDIKNLPRRKTARRKPRASRICREDIEEETNGIKTPAEKKKKPMVSRICREDTQQQEETNGVKNLPKRHLQQEENQGLKTPAKKNLQQEIQEETARSKPSPDWLTEGIVFKTLVGSASVVSESALDG